MSEKKPNWKERKEQWVNAMENVVLWDKGTDAQQEFADTLVSGFCKGFANLLYRAVRDGIISLEDAESIVDAFYWAIGEIDDARWWCNKKQWETIKIAMKLTDDDEYLELLKKIKKAYHY